MPAIWIQNSMQVWDVLLILYQNSSWLFLSGIHPRTISVWWPVLLTIHNMKIQKNFVLMLSQNASGIIILKLFKWFGIWNCWNETCLIYICFCSIRYCIGTVLNTLACEGEMRLKLQCQNLLIIARKLVSHLGKCIISFRNDSLDNHKEANIFYSLQGNLRTCAEKSCWKLRNWHWQKGAPYFCWIKKARNLLQKYLMGFLLQR